MKSAWQEWKEKQGGVTVFDMFKSEKVNEEVSEKRLNICLECPELIQLTKQCKQCGCFMKAKVQIQKATCPMGKW